MAGILIVNLGTPDNPQPPAVRRYLREFLFDPEVIDIPTIPRWILVNLIIAPFRAFKSARAYQKIWYPEGSPLLIHTEALVDNVREALNDHTVVMAMRYGSPSIEQGLTTLAKAGETDIVVLPLYPQYAGATTRTVINKVIEMQEKVAPNLRIHNIESFFDTPSYISSLAKTVQHHQTDYDHLLMSYHGLPIRQLPCVENNTYVCKGGASSCPGVDSEFPNCYRSHCYATSRALAKALSLEDCQYSVSFQSRLGNIPWIQPYTSDHIHTLVEQGVKRLAVVCPAFISDCLETLEEINMEIRADFLEAGGEHFEYIPCINEEASWAIDLLTDKLSTLAAT